MAPRISIITPTYNRRHLLGELFKSLKKQTSLQFEWIIVDDGSADDTASLVQEFIGYQCDFSINYLIQKNSGKHIAINNGVQHANGDFIFIVDSDDMLPKDSISTIIHWIDEIAGRDDLAAVAGLKGCKISQKVIGQFPSKKRQKGYIEARNNERRKNHLLGDKAEIYKKDILLKYPFKKFPGENFLSEATVWDEIAYAGYKIRWYNKIIYYCDYLEDGLTKAGEKKELENFKGFTYFTNQRIKCSGCIEKLMAKGYFWNIAKKKGISLKEANHLISTSSFFILVCHNLWKLKNLIVKFFGRI